MVSILVFLPSQTQAENLTPKETPKNKVYRVEVLSKEVIDTSYSGDTKIVKMKETIKLLDKPTLDDLIADNQDYINFLESEFGEKGKEMVKVYKQELKEIADNIQEEITIEVVKEGDHSITYGTTTRDAPNGNIKDPVDYRFWNNGHPNDVAFVIDTYASHAWGPTTGSTQYLYIDNTSHGGSAVWVSDSKQLREGNFYGSGTYHLRVFNGGYDSHGIFGLWSIGAVHKETWNTGCLCHTIDSNGWELAETELKNDLTGKTRVGAIGTTSMNNAGTYQGSYNDGTGRTINITN